jgi:sugar lactone lactonase YvrE
MMRVLLIAFCSLGVASTARASLLVSNYLGTSIRRYDHSTGAAQGNFADASEGVRGPEGMSIGPDGNVYIVMGEVGNSPEVIRRFTPAGVPLGVFATLGNSTFANRLTFGPDGNLYVSFATAPYVRRYNGTTGEFIGSFAQGGELSIGAGLVFGIDSNLYVSSHDTESVKRYDGATGQYLGNFATGIVKPTGLAFGPTGDLYVGSRDMDEVMRFDAATGAFLGSFGAGSGLDAPDDLAFGPDGHLYVTSANTRQIKRYHGLNGTFIDNFVASTQILPTALLFIPQNVPEPSAVASMLLALICLKSCPASRSALWAT